jgi:uncharacterized protein YndB with AHSA1/START domain
MARSVRKTVESKAATDAGRMLALARSFPVSQSRLFRAFTACADLNNWFGPEGFTVTACAVDLRVGGAWRICMRSPQGQQYCVRGVYREIERPRRLAFTWAWEQEDGASGHETLVTLSFAERNGETQLRLNQRRFESKKARDAHKRGWTSSFVCLAEYLAPKPRARAGREQARPNA